LGDPPAGIVLGRLLLRDFCLILVCARHHVNRSCCGSQGCEAQKAQAPARKVHFHAPAANITILILAMPGHKLKKESGDAGRDLVKQS
jgi:hypothetical protein